MLNKYIKNLNRILAHTRHDKPSETLFKHSENTQLYINLLIEEKGLEVVLERFADKFFKDIDDKDKFKKLLLLSIQIHDIGKINSNYQAVKMDNDFFETNIDFPTTNHSFYSAYLYLEIVTQEVINIDEDKGLLFFALLNAYIISKHHGRLDTFSNFIEKLKDSILNEAKELLSSFKNFSIDNLEDLDNYEDDVFDKYAVYTYSKFLFSLMTAADFYATADYMTEMPEDLGNLTNIEEVNHLIKNNDIFKKIREHEAGNNPFPKDSINVLRSEMFLEAEKNLLSSLHRNIYYLEMPTGGGKTITSINLALKLIEHNEELNKILYIFPFNTLIEQTKSSLIDILGKKYVKDNIGVINSITAIEERNEDKVKNYNKALMDRDFLHYPFTLTSHVRLFQILFGTGKQANYPLYNLANSVIVLDEIQSYKVGIWREMVHFLNLYADLLNIKFIIMSATLPELNYLANNNNCVNLISNRDKYYNNPLFKNRVTIDYSLMELTEIELVRFISDYTKKHKEEKILIEFITKKTAFQFYKVLKEEKVDVELISGNDPKIERKRIIDRSKSKNEVFTLIGTQVIEAGIDIDFDTGFKEKSILDSEEQFMGRIDRSCTKNGKGKAYFFNLNNANKIYRGDIRATESYTLSNLSIRKILKNKNFKDFYSLVLESLKGRLQKLERHINELNFSEIENYMRLIDSQENYTIMLNTSENAEEVWKRYKFLTDKDNHMNYAKKIIKLSQVAEVMNNYLYTIWKEPTEYTEKVNGIYYFKDGNKYIEDGKFNQESVEVKK